MIAPDVNEDHGLSLYAPARRARHAGGGVTPHAVSETVSGPGGTDLPVPRPHRDGDALRADLCAGKEDQSEPRVRRTKRRGDASRRAGLACQLYAVRDLGYFDDETIRVEPIENPFGPKVLPMSPE